MIRGRWTTALLDLDEVSILRDDDGIGLSRMLVDLRVFCPQETQILNMNGLALAKVALPSGESWWKLGVNPDWRG